MSAAEPSSFPALIELAPGEGPTTFAGPAAPERFGRTFGGQFLAQALMAARLTVESERRVHSLHAYFLRAGAVDSPTIYEVESVRSGRSFAVCAVVARQGEAEVFRMMASFHHLEHGLQYQSGGRYPMGRVPPPEAAPIDYPGFAAQHPDFEPGTWDGSVRPMEIRYLDPPAPSDTGSHMEPQRMWVRVEGPLGNDPAIHEAGLAYLADSTLVDNVMLPHGFRWQDARLTGASLDHAMWFHRPTLADGWLLYDQRVEVTGGARGLATGRFYDPDGHLVATCMQEGLIRWDQQ
ncbi:MAG: acyl-CoA thioesterase II [Actinomycetia bacterium]|nr:acyl-CoA thioesterase II [Actinomycetes bacterium]MCP5031961.1 acyl-CoA thioesterase II [Actinomycetes bacterium]